MLDIPSDREVSPPALIQHPGSLPTLAEAIARRELSPVELLQRYLKRIDAVEPEVRAWRVLDAERALVLARRRADEAARGEIRGPLHGIPFGVKDIIDVEGLPTRCNSAAREDIAPATADAEIVLQLKARGAIVLGKLQTTEFAWFRQSPARNPWNTEHTPGGSSSGSAAAVAAGMVPLALGTQTVASHNRPAAYCGIAAFKPSTGSISAWGVVPLAPSYDTTGVYGARVADATFAFRAIRPAFIPPGRALATDEGLEVVVLRDPLLDSLSDDSRRTWESMAQRLADRGHRTTMRDSPVSLARVGDLLERTVKYEAARAHRALLDFADGLVDPILIEDLREGLTIDEDVYLKMRAELTALRSEFFSALGRHQIVLFPATPATAPVKSAGTGDFRYIAPWTALGGPIVTVPAGLAGDGLPLGCLLCGHPGSDADLALQAGRLAAVGELSALRPPA